MKPLHRKSSYVESVNSSACSSSFSSLSSRSKFSSTSTVSEHPKRSRRYKRIRKGLRKSIPAAIVLWAFQKLPSSRGLTSRQVINFIKKHYRVVDNPRNTGKSIGTMLRCAVDFGLLEKRGQKYFLASRQKAR